MQSNQKNRSGLRRRMQRGVELIEFTLVLLPFLGFTALILDIAYSVYQRATIQHAVSQAVRYAVTSQVMTGMGARASTQTYVLQNAFGTLAANPGSVALGTNGWHGIYVDWYLVDPNTGSYASQDGISGGNCMQTDGNLPLVSVSVQNFPGSLLVPFVKSPGMGSLGGITTGAVAWDRMEAPAESNGGYVCPAQ